MKTTIDWGSDEIIDSRDLLKRHGELQDEYDSLVESLGEANENLESVRSGDSTLVELQDAENSVAEAQEALDAFNQSFEKDELDTLTEVISQAEDSPDWSYGEALILDSYFVTYIQDLVEDCYEMPKELNSGKWPWNHVTLDYAAAAEEAKQDYIEVDVGGSVYYIRA
jgi:hypothetical protein